MLETLAREIQSEGFTLEETKVPTNNQPEFWHASLISSSGHPISGGFGHDRSQARKIAIAEFLERRAFRRISAGGSAERAAWGLDIIPTACGFAAGFDRANTILRSINEATERWVMSKWIDDHYQIEELSISDVATTLDPISRFFLSQFETVRFFKKDVCYCIGSQVLKIEVGQTMGLIGQGIFPGSSAQFTGGSLWQHALLESFRHLLAVRNNPKRDLFPSNKVHYFSTNSQVALQQISQAQKKEWPLPRIRLHKIESYLKDQYFVARTIIDGWQSWHEGPLTRFLY